MVKRILAAAAMLAPFATGSAHAATSAINNFQVTISITTGCTISATDIAFGNLQGSILLTTAQTSTAAMGGLFHYQCAAGAGPLPVLTASSGAHPSGAQARMIGLSGGFINYNLTMPSLVAFTGAPQAAQIIANIPTVATAPAVDSYSDMVTLTMTY